MLRLKIPHAPVKIEDPKVRNKDRHGLINKQQQQERKPSLIGLENRWMVARRRGRGWEEGEIGEGGPKVPTSSYKTCHRDVTYSTMTIVNNTLSHV